LRLDRHCLSRSERASLRGESKQGMLAWRMASSVAPLHRFSGSPVIRQTKTRGAHMHLVTSNKADYINFIAWMCASERVWHGGEWVGHRVSRHVRATRRHVPSEGPILRAHRHAGCRDCTPHAAPLLRQ
jgi:hypothetical protein